MSQPNPQSLDEQSLQRSRSLDASGDRVDLARLGQSLAQKLANDPQLRVEDLLDIAACNDRGWLLSQLIPAEVNKRRVHGELPTVAEYVSRFPAYESDIRSTFAEMESYSISKLPTATLGLEPNQEVSLIGSAVELPLATPVSGLTGQSVGRYQLERLLGSGGFAQVWLAYDPLLERRVAIKVTRPDRFWSMDAYRSMAAEARRVAKLGLAGVVPVYDLVEQGSDLYIVSKYMAGGTLRDVLRQRTLSVQEGAALLRKVSLTLHKAHQQNILHRDIKSGNILLDEEGEPHVADFGIAVTLHEQERESRQILGSFSHMSPEQARGENNQLDPRTDIYSLGMVLYEVLTGRTAFRGSTAEEFLQKIQKEAPVSPRVHRPEIPEGLETVCLKALEKDPGGRFATALDFAEALLPWLGNTGSQADIRDVWKRDAVAEDSLGLQVAQRPTLSKMDFWTSLVLIGGSLVLAFALGVRWLTAGPATTPSPQPEEPALPSYPLPIAEAEIIPWRDSVADLPTWFKDWKCRPSEINYPGYVGIGSIFYRTNEKRCEVTANYTRLIAMGNLKTDKDYQISVTCGQPTAVGSYGLFFQYQTTMSHGIQVPVYQLIVLENRDGNAPNPFRILRKVIVPGESTSLPTSIVESNYQVLSRINPSRMPQLVVQVGKSGLQLVRYDQEEVTVPLSAPANPKEKLPTEFSGVWGLFHSSGTTWFSSPLIEEME